MEGRGRGKFCKNREEIGYEEFVCNIELTRNWDADLVLADENKRSPEAVRYWFNILDLEFSGEVSLSTIYAFYASQVIHSACCFSLEIAGGGVWHPLSSLSALSADAVRFCEELLSVDKTCWGSRKCGFRLPISCPRCGRSDCPSFSKWWLWICSWTRWNIWSSSIASWWPTSISMRTIRIGRKPKGKAAR